MKPALLILLTSILILVSSCEKKVETIEGDLYFKLIDFGSFYQSNDSFIHKFEEELEKDLDKNYYFIELISKLKKHGLIYKPFIRMRIDSSNFIAVYLDESEYSKVKDYKWTELVDEGKKIRISVTGKFVEGHMFDCSSINSIEKVDGVTYWDK